MRRAVKVSAISLATAMLIVLVRLAFEYGVVAFNSPSRERYAIRGIDVSHHRGRIDWQAVRDDGVSFAYVKATEGGDFVDSRFASNWRDARAARLAVGAYHFFTFCRDGASQAANVLRVVPRETDALPLGVDLEFGGNCGRLPSRVELHTELKSFLAPLREAYGREPILYVTEEFFRAYEPNGELWVRDVFTQPDWLGDRTWLIWQYGNRGRIAGIRGPVDLNVFGSSRSEWQRFRRGTRVTELR